MSEKTEDATVHKLACAVRSIVAGILYVLGTVVFVGAFVQFNHAGRFDGNVAPSAIANAADAMTNAYLPMVVGCLLFIAGAAISLINVQKRLLWESVRRERPAR